jgi:RND family efflux transporter MFP subunit
MASTDTQLASRRRRRIGILAAIGLAVLAAIAGSLWLLSRPATVSAEAARIGPAVESVYASGVVDFVRQASISPVVNSPIRSVLVAEGADVRPGQVLAVLVDGPEQASLMQLRVQAEQARSAAARTEFLYRRGYAAYAAWDIARRQYQAAAAAADAAQARLADFRITAPFAGRVIRREAEPGNVATPGQALFVIADPNTLRITADVDERDAGRLSVGQEALVRSDAFPGRSFRAAVAEITPQGDSNGRVFRARLTVEPQSALRAGMTVEINIVLARRDRAVLVSTRAVSDAHVWVAAGGQARRRAVTLGVRGADRTEILSGLRAGEMAILDPPAGLRDGARIRLRPPAGS